MTKSNDYYENLIAFAFDRPAAIETWGWDMDLKEPSASAEEQVRAIARMCRNSGADLAGFTDLQVAGGLTYIFNNALSNISYALLDKSIPVSMRSPAVLSLKILFAECFAPRCLDATSNGLTKSLDNPLNNVCYMFWDFSPLSEAGADAIAVMESTLYLNNRACIESGLHGLGHQFYKNEHIVETIIDTFLTTNPAIDQHLKDYAKNARRGYIA
jgi:hypothetical protein